MRQSTTTRDHVILGAALLAAAALVCAVPAKASAQAKTAPRPFAETLVEAAHAQHPEADEIGILATTDQGCMGIASTDSDDVGEACEAEDVQPMRTGKTSIEKEGRGYSVSVLLHDATGKVVGVLAVGFEGASGRTQAEVTEIARKMESEMAAKISSKERLLAGWR